MESKKKRLKNWLTDKHNLIALIIIGFGILLRLYYLFQTHSQTLWWDEAEYLLLGQYLATGDMFMNFLASRPLLLPLIVAFFIKIGLHHEIVYRMLELIISSLGIVFLYKTTKELFNKEVGIISALLLSVFYLHLFYTARILLDSIAPTFWVLSIYFFTTGYLIKKNNKRFYLSALFGAIGILFYNQTIALFLLYLIFLLLVEKLNLIKEKRFYLFGIIALATLSINFILNQIIHKDPIAFIKIGIKVGDVLTANYWQNLWSYSSYLTSYLGIILTIVFFITLVIVFFKMILGLDIVIKKPDLEMKKNLFLFLWLFVSFFALIKIVGHFEDRYIMPTFLPLFIVTALGLYKLKESISKSFDKRIVYAVLIILLVVISFTQVKKSEETIKMKVDSFAPLKEAALWIKDNSNSQDTILTSSSPMMLYYSQRKITPFPEKEEELLPLIEKEKPKYLVLSVFTGNPTYVNNLLSYKIFNPVKTYKLGDSTVLIISEIKYNQ